jgi:hypothetical protein
MEWTPARGQARQITAQFDRVFHEITSKQSTPSVFQKGFQQTCAAIDNAATTQITSVGWNFSSKLPRLRCATKRGET